MRIPMLMDRWLYLYIVMCRSSLRTRKRSLYKGIHLNSFKIMNAEVEDKEVHL